MGELKPFNVLNASSLNEENRPELLEKVKAIANDILFKNSAHHKMSELKRMQNMNLFEGMPLIFIYFRFE